jgi:hypothetical protein
MKLTSTIALPPDNIFFIGITELPIREGFINRDLLNKLGHMYSFLLMS